MTATDPTTLRLLAESFEKSGSGKITLCGDSMAPTLLDGWIVHVRSLAAAELRVGDIGVFINRGVLTVHRLIWKKTDGRREEFIFQGDNNAVRERVKGQAVLGRVFAAERPSLQDSGALKVSLATDRRALFYRTAHRLYSLLSPLVPGIQVPGEGSQGGFAYRRLRPCFRLLERLFSPRPR